MAGGDAALLVVLAGLALSGGLGVAFGGLLGGQWACRVWPSGQWFVEIHEQQLYRGASAHGDGQRAVGGQMGQPRVDLAHGEQPAAGVVEAPAVAVVDIPEPGQIGLNGIGEVVEQGQQPRDRAEGFVVTLRMSIGSLTDAHGGGESVAGRDQLGAGRGGVEEVVELFAE